MAEETRLSTETRSTEGDTRRQVMLLLLKDGPITASDLGTQLGLSAAGVRRHLDILVEDGLTEIVNRRPQPKKGQPAVREDRLSISASQIKVDPSSVIHMTSLLRMRWIRCARSAGLKQLRSLPYPVWSES